MFENLSIEALQNYWWIIVSLLGSVLVFLMFVQGGQTLLWQIAKSETEKTLLINSIGKKWDLTFTTLVTFGGAFFASFPLFYATSFGGAYWVWMLILFGFIFQAVSFEFRKKSGNFLGAKMYEFFLILNGILAPVLIGAAVSTFFTGSEFSVNEYNLSKWENPARGLEAALNIQNLMLGLAVFFLTRILGAQFFLLTIDHNEIASRARKQILINSVPFLITFLGFVIMLILKDGFACDPVSQTVIMEPNKYLHNLLQMPIVLVLFLAGVLLVLTGIYISTIRKGIKGINFTGAGTVLAAFSLFMLAGFNNTAYYPSTFDLQSSLTIRNSSSSHYTLTAMSYVSLFVPFVIAYIWWAWKSLTKKKMTADEIEENQKTGEHQY